MYVCMFVRGTSHPGGGRGPHSLVPQQSPTKAPRLNMGLGALSGVVALVTFDKGFCNFRVLLIFGNDRHFLTISEEFSFVDFLGLVVLDLSCRPCGNVCAKI